MGCGASKMGIITSEQPAKGTIFIPIGNPMPNTPSPLEIQASEKRQQDLREEFGL
jgi:hypothetical protein